LLRLYVHRVSLSQLAMHRIFLFVLIFASLTAATGALQGPPLPEKRVLFSVVDASGKLITGFSKEQLRLREEGIPRPITSIQSAAAIPLSIIVLIDNSSSTTKQSSVLGVAAKQLLSLLIRPGTDKASIASFGKTITLQQQPIDDLPALHSAIDNISAIPDGARSKTTAIFDAVVAGADHLASSPGRRAILLFTDGYEGSSRSSHERTTERLQMLEVALHVFCSNTTDLRRVAEQTGGSFYQRACFTPPTNGDLKNIATQVTLQQMLTFVSSAPNSKRRFNKIQIDGVLPGLQKLEFRHRMRLPVNP
jgi:VWFA-related protein